ncbi:hypothetical protein S1361_14435 [Streptomyces cyanogenus]|uniref:Uncharacterized protein n=1 Tax=Streptomyces cyanogenus TaxID=80860 RepID=A0ABX7TSY1_STRCY|nr:hypothetical protein S1361_14435 [Streptomyces cyanogenus]
MHTERGRGLVRSGRPVPDVPAPSPAAASRALGGGPRFRRSGRSAAAVPRPGREAGHLSGSRCRCRRPGSGRGPRRTRWEWAAAVPDPVVGLSGGGTARGREARAVRERGPVGTPLGTGKRDTVPERGPVGTPLGTGKRDTVPEPNPAGTPLGTGKRDTVPERGPVGTPLGTGKRDTVPEPNPAGTPLGTGKRDTVREPNPARTPLGAEEQGARQGCSARKRGKRLAGVRSARKRGRGPPGSRRPVTRRASCGGNERVSACRRASTRWAAGPSPGPPSRRRRSGTG